MKVKRLLMMAVAGAVSLSGALAEDGVIVTLRGGQKVGFAFSARPALVAGAQMEMRSKNGEVLVYPYDNVKTVTWGSVDGLVTAINDATPEKANNIVFKICGDGITATGMKGGERLSAYSLDGKLVGSATAVGEEQTHLSLPDGKGVYIVRTSSGVSYKFAKSN